MLDHLIQMSHHTRRAARRIIGDLRRLGWLPALPGEPTGAVLVRTTHGPYRVMRVGRVIARDLPGGQPGEPFRVILNANEGEGLDVAQVPGTWRERP